MLSSIIRFLPIDSFHCLLESLDRSKVWQINSSERNVGYIYPVVRWQTTRTKVGWRTRGALKSAYMGKVWPVGQTRCFTILDKTKKFCPAVLG